MTALYILFLVSLLFGQLGGISLKNGAVFYIHDIVLLVFLIGSLYQWHQRKMVNHPRLLFPIVGFVVVAVISLIVAIPRIGIEHVLISSLYLVRWVMYSLLYIVLVHRVLPAETLLLGLYSFGVSLAILGFAQFIVFPDLRQWTYLGWDPHLYRLFSTLLDPNFTGLLLVLTLLLGVYMWEKNRNRFIVACEFMLLIAIYLTYSRSSYLGLCAGILALIILMKKWILSAFIGMFVLIVLIVPTPGGKTLRLDRVDSTIARFGNWKQSVQLISKSPLIGFGFNTLKYVNKPLMQSPGADIRRASSGIDSSILFIMATTGIVGLVVSLWLVISFFVIPHTTGKQIFFRNICLAMGLSTLMHSFFSNSLFYAWVMIFGWIVIAGYEITSGK